MILEIKRNVNRMSILCCRLLFLKLYTVKDTEGSEVFVERLNLTLILYVIV